MSNLQKTAQFVMSPLIHGDWEKFDAEVVDVISLWAVMTACTISAASGDPPIPFRTREEFMKNCKIPNGFTVFIGRISKFVAPEYNHCYGSSAQPEGPSAIPDADVTVVTILLKQLSLQVIHVPKLPFNPARYGTSIGVHPIHPWVDTLDWRFIPIIRNGSPQLVTLKNAFIDSIAARSGSNISM